MREAKKPPTAPPKGNPAHNMATSVARNRFGAYSDARLMKLGIAPPKPTPVKNRITSS